MAENENKIIVVDTDEAGQVTGFRSLQSGDTISDELLNTDIRNAGSNASTALTTAQSASQGVSELSGYIDQNQTEWAEGIDSTTLANLVDTSSRFADFKDNVSGTLASKDTINNNNLISGKVVAGTNLEDNAVSAGQIDNNTITATQIAPTTITNAEISTGAAIAVSKLGTIPAGTVLANNSTTDADTPAGVKVTDAVIDPGTIDGSKLRSNTVDTAQIKADAVTTTEIADDAGITSDQLAGNIAISKLQNDLPADTVLGRKNGAGAGVPQAMTATEARSAMGLGALAQLDSVGTAQIANDSITNDDIKSDADIAGSKLAAASIGSRELDTVGTAVTQTKNSIVTTDANGRVTACTSGAQVYVNRSIGFVSISGTEGGDLSPPTPVDNSVLMYDATANRFKYKKVRGGIGAGEIDGDMIEDDAINADKILTGAVGVDQLASNLNIESNIAANNIGFGKLTLISAQTIVGNPEPTLGGPMQALTKAQTRNILGVSAGTTAPPSPDAGDLWYNTTDDELYTYDSGRGHWLGAPHYISFGKTVSTSPGVGHYLYVGHQGTTATTSERGWLVPHDMVITGWRGHTQSTFTDWTFRVDKNSGGTNTTGIVSTGALGAVDTFSDFTTDVDVAAGDILGVAGVTGTSTLNNSTVTVKIQRKGA